MTSVRPGARRAALAGRPATLATAIVATGTLGLAAPLGGPVLALLAVGPILALALAGIRPRCGRAALAHAPAGVAVGTGHLEGGGVGTGVAARPALLGPVAALLLLVLATLGPGRAAAGLALRLLRWRSA